MSKFNSFWTGPIWREIEVFACGMAGAPPPPKRYGLMSDNRALYEDAERVEDGEVDVPGDGIGAADD